MTVNVIICANKFENLVDCNDFVIKPIRNEQGNLHLPKYLLHVISKYEKSLFARFSRTLAFSRIAEPAKYLVNNYKDSEEKYRVIIELENSFQAHFIKDYLEKEIQGVDIEYQGFEKSYWKRHERALEKRAKLKQEAQELEEVQAISDAS